MPLSSEGKVLSVKGKKMRLYPISTLSQKLSKTLGEERTTQTIRKWELKGVIPPATFRHKQKRLYTMEQINIICKIAKEENIRQGYALSLTNFSKRVFEEWKKINARLLENEKEKER